MIKYIQVGGMIGGTMESAIDEKGRVVIPKRLRERAGLREGARVRLSVERGRITVAKSVTTHMIRKQRDIDIRNLKNALQKRLPAGSVFREVILAEPDRLDPQDFLGRVPVWLKLAEMEDEVERR